MTVRLEIGEGVYCYNLPQAAKDKIHKDLTFTNKVYADALEQGRYIDPLIEPYIYFFKHDTKRNTYWITRGYIHYLRKWLKQNNYNVKIKNHTITFKKIKINFVKGKGLWDYQQKAVNDMLKYPVGVLEGDTGSGKTVDALGIIVARKQRTLIIVHSKLLLYQWEERIYEFLGYKAGLIGDGKNNTKDITVGIINSVRNKVDKLHNKFGQIIVDECHRCPSDTWTITLQKFLAKYYLGLTATPFRRDGLGFAIFATIGPKLHKVDEKMLRKEGRVLTPTIIRVPTYFYYNDFEARTQYSTMLAALTRDKDRNKLIVSKIVADLKKYKQNIVVGSDRKQHCLDLQKLLLKKGVKSEVIISSTPTKERTRIIKDVNAGICKILISTVALIGEGFDAPRLSALFIVTPIKFSGRLIQIGGRILRPSDEENPRLYDFRDNQVSTLKYSGYARDKAYKKKWGN